MSRKPLAKVTDVPNGKSLKIYFQRSGKMVEGFLACYQGKIVAYENECRHLPVSLDYGLGRFFTRDGKFFICQTHSALYDPLTGLCTDGPCVGEKLRPIRIRVAGGKIWLAEPPEKRALRLRLKTTPRRSRKKGSVQSK
jgi:nitrite reductase/ring-hydroxylating ferredoxin subunit